MNYFGFMILTPSVGIFYRFKPTLYRNNIVSNSVRKIILFSFSLKVVESSSWTFEYQKYRYSRPSSSISCRFDPQLFETQAIKVWSFFEILYKKIYYTGSHAVRKCRDLMVCNEIKSAEMIRP